MHNNNSPTTPHPEGEPQNESELARNQATKEALMTEAGRVHVEWEEDSAMAPMGQFVFFAQFLSMTKLFSETIEWGDKTIFIGFKDLASKDMNSFH